MDVSIRMTFLTRLLRISSWALLAGFAMSFVPQTWESTLARLICLFAISLGILLSGATTVIHILRTPEQSAGGRVASLVVVVLTLPISGMVYYFCLVAPRNRQPT